MAKYRVIGQAEFECFVEASSEEEALGLIESAHWHRTMNKPLSSFQVTGKEEESND